MNIAEYSIRNKVVTWLITIIFVGGGLMAYENIGKLEDPKFTIKEAKVITYYPGATPMQVQEEVTYHVEEAMQQLEQLKRLKMSISREGYSEVSIEFKDKYKPEDMPNIYDEVRRKIQDMQHKLPPGAGKPIVVDDFADVFGIYLALTGEGYSYRDLRDFAEQLKRDLVLVDGVRKINITGSQEEVVYVQISRAKMADLGLSINNVINVLESQNVVADAGNVRVGNEYIRITPTGEFSSVKDIGNALISSHQKKLVYLSDIATVERMYRALPSNPTIYFNGQPALALGISMQSGVSVVDVGAELTKRIDALNSQFPVGVELHDIYNQPNAVNESVNGFVMSVVEAFVIVVLILLVFMGLHTGLIIGAILLITVLGTLWIMNMFGMELQRISLGALIIALGMLVDNAIVVAEGMLIKIKNGEKAIPSAKDVVNQTVWALLGGTVIGILAFSGIGLSENNTGEFTRSLFYVILISLSLSWFTAITTTPLLCSIFLKADKNKSNVNADPYAGKLFQIYRNALHISIRHRYAAIITVIVLFASSIVGFGYLKSGFFPVSNTPLFFVDVWEVEGTDIRKTEEDVLRLDEFIRSHAGVTKTTTIVGQGATRFTLVYSPESASNSYAQILVYTETIDQIPALKKEIWAWMDENLPDTEPKVKDMRIGPGRDSKVEARFSGPDPVILRELSEKAQAIMFADYETKEVRDDWRQPVKLIKPIFNESVARQLGITRQELSSALQSAFEGIQVGTYRDGIYLLPILMIPPEEERDDVSGIHDVRVWSPTLERTIPIGQVVTNFDGEWENAVIRSRNRALTIIASCNPTGEFADAMFSRLVPQIEAIELPPGYKLEWGGEFEDSRDAKSSLFGVLPGSFLLMIITSILLFGSIRQPLIIWLTVPLAIVGITAGLFVFDGAFDFMSLLGALSLVGLLIKNAIVLIEEMDLQVETGKPRLTAILDASTARMRPVMMAASTTILGLIPLLSDVFFQNMAITIMAGLGFASVLTLIIVPVLYTILFRIKNTEL